MFHNLFALLPPEASQILEVLFLSFLLGLEREEHKATGNGYRFGGVRTFPLIGLLGYGLGVLDAGPGLLAAGLLALAALMGLSYAHKLKVQEFAGATTELSGLGIFLVGALIARQHPWLACTVVVATLLLLELKEALEGLARRLPSSEIITFAKFLTLAVVILPVVPNQDFTPFQLNPYKTWLVVVAVSAVSYGGYLLERLTKGKAGVFLSALLGGAYSSTVTTVVLAKRSTHEQAPQRFAGSILAASGVMYLRLAILVTLFNGALGRMLAPALLSLGGLGLLAGWLIARRGDPVVAGEAQSESRNPLDLKAAFLFAGIFLAMLVLTRLAATHLGHSGLYSLAGLMGVSDVDPFIMGLTQTAGSLPPLHTAAVAVLLAAASNNLVKGIYAKSFGSKEVGTKALVMLGVLAVAGVVAVGLI